MNENILFQVPGQQQHQLRHVLQQGERGREREAEPELPELSDPRHGRREGEREAGRHQGGGQALRDGQRGHELHTGEQQSYSLLRPPRYVKALPSLVEGFVVVASIARKESIIGCPYHDPTNANESKALIYHPS